MRHRWTPAVLAGIALMIAACTGAPSTAPSSAAGSPSASTVPEGSPRALKIAFLLWSLEGYRQQADVAAFKAQMEAQGDDVTIVDSRNDAALQKTQVDQLITQQVDAVVLWPVDSASACGLVKSLETAHISVVSYNDAIPSCPEVDYLISRDNYAVGVALAKNAVDSVPKGNYVLVGGDEAHTVGREFHRGWIDGLKPTVDAGDIKIVSDAFHKDWNAADGLTQVEQALTASSNDVQAIIAGYDGYVEPILGALQAQGLEGKVWVGGHDADLNVVRAILAGNANYSGWTPTGQMGKAAAIAARSLALGESLPPGTIEIPLEDGSSVNGQTFLSVGVTKSNLPDWLCTEKYYTVEQVYKDIVPEDQWPAC